MVYLDCSGIVFMSQLDEKYLFEWAEEISCVMGWSQDKLIIRSRRISESNLRELLAMFWRYGIPMTQLAQFKNSANVVWFTDPLKYWHKKVFC